MSSERTLALPARSRLNVSPRQPRVPGWVAMAVPLVLAPVLVLVTILIWSGHSAAHQAAAGRSATIDPRLILQPHTVSQTVYASGLGLTLTASPLLPGGNHFEVRLGEHGRPLAGARVILTARMIGMAMRPITVPLSEVRPGRYTGMGPLAMFGPWRITVHVDRPGTPSLDHPFMVGVDLPNGLLTELATQAGPRQ